LNARSPITAPIVRTPSRLRPADNYARAVTAVAFGKATRTGAEAAFRQLFGTDDEVTPVLIRAAVSGATLSNQSWAGALASQAVGDFMGSLGPVSAASTLFNRAMRVSFPNGHSSITVPGYIASAGGASFVGEGQPIPARSLSVSAPVLTPRKVAAIAALSREMLEYGNAEPVIRAALVENTGLALDAAMFGTAAAGTAPAGLRNGVTGLTPTAGGGIHAMTRDLGALAAAVAPVGGSNIVFVAAPGEHAKILLTGSDFAYPVLASGALPSGTVLAIAASALAVAVGVRPEIDVAEETTLHMDDAPAQIGSGSGVAAPVISVFQTGQIALRTILQADWVLRAPGSVAWVASVTW